MSNYLTFESEDNLAFTLNTYNTTKNWDGTLEYSIDTTSWSTWDGTLINSSSNGKLYLRGINNTKITGDSEDYRFVLDGSSTAIQCNGNIENLLDYIKVANGEHPAMASKCFYSLFDRNSLLTIPPSLPAVTLSTYCYAKMFYYCRNLKTITKLPATYLVDHCYYSMFMECSNIEVYEDSSTAHPYEWRIPTSGTATTDGTSWGSSMLLDAYNTFFSSPSINTTYYTNNQPIGEEVPATYDVTINANGGTGTSTLTDKTEITTDDLATIKTQITRDGYILTGLSETSTGNAVTLPYTLTADKTMYCVWATQDNLQTKTTKLINYAKSQLSSKGVTSTATTLRGALDDISNISAGGTQATLNAPTISFSDSILTLTNPTTNGDFAQGFNIYNGSALLSTQLIDVTTLDLSTLLTEEGTYTITAKCYGTNMTESNASGSVIYVISPPPAVIYGVSGLYQSEPALTRTDDAVNMTYSINSTTGEITSDFSNVFPYNQMTRETINGNVFVNVPSMWWRITTDSDNRLTSVAVSNQRGSGDNWYQSRAFKYGAYGGSVSDDVLKSVSGVARKVSLTRANARTYAMANGTGYHQRDLYSYTILMFLWYIEFATKNSASIMYGANPSKVNTGGTDSLGFSTGYNPSTNQMIWHNIEDFIGNVYEWEDGITGNGTSGGTQYVSADCTKYNDTGSDMNTLSFNSPTTSGNCLSALGWDSNNPFLVQPIETVSNSSYNTYFCDYSSTSNNIVSDRGADWNVNSNNGLSSFYRAGASYSNNNFGCRLLYTP